MVSKAVRIAMVAAVTSRATHIIKTVAISEAYSAMFHKGTTISPLIPSEPETSPGFGRRVDLVALRSVI